MYKESRQGGKHSRVAWRRNAFNFACNRLTPDVLRIRRLAGTTLISPHN
jgi:hypothetical protein